MESNRTIAAGVWNFIMVKRGKASGHAIIDCAQSGPHDTGEKNEGKYG